MEDQKTLTPDQLSELKRLVLSIRDVKRETGSTTVSIGGGDNYAIVNEEALMREIGQAQGALENFLGAFSPDQQEMAGRALGTILKRDIRPGKLSNTIDPGFPYGNVIHAVQIFDPVLKGLFPDSVIIRQKKYKENAKLRESDPPFGYRGKETIC